jgi:hypothetical protein
VICVINAMEFRRMRPCLMGHGAGGGRRRELPRLWLMQSVALGEAMSGVVGFAGVADLERGSWEDSERCGGVQRSG